ncbi:TetR/AcrR family transcriptional regulator [Vibrio europaeus]|uniref:TetR/AcrR family transcriptional regulator n=1 Tax=Vibrio europaeus TaxID=300876 RepID=UPI00233F2D02|nr:TetR/AcrR family transcriptional regulator [Vibrio europaeus]MDC5818668.1 TetR/AcrR family transcriptional regulator [Vibrio europaeus]MDC5871309.1 TetR/AcrR family transcriptional regulator [Vibrio europaeus]
MGRRKSFDRDEAVEKIMQLIWRYGYEHCSVKFLSEQLGMTRSSFYHSFQSRENAFVEAMSLYGSLVPYKVDLAQEGQSDVLKALSNEIKALCQWRSSDPEHRGCFGVNCITELVDKNEALGAVMEEVLMFSVERYNQILMLAAKNNELPDENLSSKALALQSVVVGINTMAKVIRDETELWSIAKYNLLALDLYRE